jgi:hypothetical protein
VPAVAAASRRVSARRAVAGVIWSIGGEARAFAGSHVVHAVFIVATIILNTKRFETGVEHTPHAVYILD